MFLSRATTLACKIGYIFFCIFQASEGKQEVSEERQTRASGEGTLKNFKYSETSKVSVLFLIPR